MTNSINELDSTDVIFIIGSNTTENHPVIATRMKRAIARGAKLIVAEPRRIEMADYADAFLQIKPGTNIALLNSIMNVIIEEDLYDKEYIEERIENFDELKEIVNECTPEKAAKICGVSAEDIRKVARIYAEGERGSIYYAMGVTQHTTGTHGVMTVANLAMLCGNVGIEGGGVNPLRGQSNVQGACDMGGLPDVLPGYQKVANLEAIEKFEKAWGTELSSKVGLTSTEVMHKAETGDIKLLYIVGENPMVSDPDINKVKKSLENIEFLVVQEIFMTETAELADVVLPASSFAEKDGTFTNTERRVQRIRKAVDLPGEAKPDWEIIMDIMNKIGCEKKYSNPMEIMEEIAEVTPQYAGIDYDRIEGDGLQWPCPSKEHLGTGYLHKDKFARGKGLFIPHKYIESAETTDEEYPFILTTGRVLYQYHTRTMTGRVEGLNKKAPSSYIEINPDMANKLGFVDGEKVRVSSRRGEIITTIKTTDIIANNVVFMPFHFADGAVNYLTNSVVDEIAKIPELKVSAVNISKL